jgi:hypothetical protein
VTTIDMPMMDPPASLIIWRRRAFVLGHDGQYREAMIYRASDPLIPE